MFDAVVGISVGYTLLAAGVCWMLVKLRGNLGVKVVVTAVLIYYGFAVFYAMPNIMGWAFKKALPADAKIISIRIVEPLPGNEGGIWFWLNEEPDMESDVINLMNPKKVFIYTGKLQPRAYKIEYDRDIHKKIIEMMKQQEKMQGSALMTGKKGVKVKQGGGQGVGSEEKPPFKILNPYEMMSKDDE